MLTGFLRDELDGMLVPDPLLGRTRLAWLGTGPVSSTPAAVKGEFYGTHSVDVAGELAKLGSDGYRPLRADTLTAVLAGA
jgi:hypothetical protein